jgi:hypothetical protein
LETQHLKGKLGILDTKQILLPDFLTEYLQHTKANKAPNTYRLEKGIAKTLLTHFGNVLLRTIDNYELEGYKASRVNRGLKPNSTNREIIVIKYMLRKAKDWKYIEDIPNIKLLKVPNRPIEFACGGDYVLRLTPNGEDATGGHIKEAGFMEQDTESHYIKKAMCG